MSVHTMYRCPHCHELANDQEDAIQCCCSWSWYAEDTVEGATIFIDDDSRYALSQEALWDAAAECYGVTAVLFCDDCEVEEHDEQECRCIERHRERMYDLRREAVAAREVQTIINAAATTPPRTPAVPTEEPVPQLRGRSLEDDLLG